MSKRARLIILIICIVAFFLLTPFVVGYSLGYRIDFEQKKIVATGGIYLRAWPSPAQVFVDSKPVDQTSLITNSIFAQNLFPRNHTITMKKESYFDYQKTLEVKEKEVTKLEHIILFKKNIAFQALVDKTQSPFQKEQPSFKNKNALFFDIYQNSVYWVSKDGSLYQSDLLGKNQSQIFESFYSPVKNIKISPDRTKVLYYNDYEILYSYLSDKNFNKIFLNRFSEKIGEVLWLNNDYVVFTLAGKIKISEIDNRNEINMVEIQQPADKIYFSQQDKKLYIQTGKEVLVSEQLMQ